MPPPTRPTHEIERLIELTGGPALLYRFRSMAERNLVALEEGKLWIGSALGFNDPFDSKPKHLLDDPAVANTYREAVRRAKVLCFSGPFKGDGDDILRWSHYADGHNGFCLMLCDPALNALAQPVNYLPAYPALDDLTLDPVEFWRRVGFFKAECWKYEDERRVFFSERESSEYVLPARTIWGVTMGCWTKREDRMRVATAALRNNSDCYFFHAEIVRGAFALRYYGATPEYHFLRRADVAADGNRT